MCYQNRVHKQTTHLVPQVSSNKLWYPPPRCDEFKKKYDSWEGSASRIIILDLLKLFKKNGHSAKGVRDQVGAEFNTSLDAKLENHIIQKCV